MNKSRLGLMAIILFSLSLPLINAITFIGPVNYIASHGGIVHFAQTFNANTLTYGTGLNQFSQVVWGGQLRGNLGFDADTGVNVTVLSITRDTIIYNVTTLLGGPRVSYVYYYRNVAFNPLTAPATVTGGTATYAAGISNVTTTGSPVTVTLSWASASTPSSTNLFSTVSVLLALIPILVLMTAASDYNAGSLGANTAFKATMIAIILGIFAWLFRSWGY